MDLYDGGYEALFTLFPPDSGNLMEVKRVRLPRGATPELLRAMRQAQVNIAMHQRCAAGEGLQELARSQQLQLATSSTLTHVDDVGHMMV